MRPLRQPWLMHAASAVMAGYLRLVFRTLRWTEEGRELVDTVSGPPGKAPNGVIVCFWHAGLALSPAAWSRGGDRQEMGGLISLSADGEFIARILQRLKVQPVRGSSAKRTNPAKNKNGEQAFREMIRWVNGGRAMGITPDGPRGPAEQMGEGPPALARVTGAPVVFLGLACRPCIRLKSWDRTVLPLPFARASVVWGGPVRVERGAPMDALPQAWTDQLAAVTARAWSLVD